MAGNTRSTAGKSAAAKEEQPPPPAQPSADQPPADQPDESAPPAEVTFDPELDAQIKAQGLPPKSETGAPATEGGPRTVAAVEGGAVIVDSPGPEVGPGGVSRQACVVDTKKWGPHVGAAVPGTVVCSRHALHFDNAGRQRQPGQTQKHIDAANAEGEPV